YLSWCNVSVNGGAASSLSPQVVHVLPGEIPLATTALVGFDLPTAPWHDTDGDAGSGDPGVLTGSGQSATRSTTITITHGPKCVWTCCPTHGLQDCPTTDQCP